MSGDLAARETPTMNQAEANIRPAVDPLIADIADYVYDYAPAPAARAAARLCLMDSVGCALMATRIPQCARHLGPWMAGAQTTSGARVIGTGYQLDPVKAAFDNGALIRWLDFNDTWLAAEWGHPSDNIAAILAVADTLSRRRLDGAPPMGEVLAAMVKAHEIQGVLALENSFNRVGLDHVVLVKVASAAVAAYLLGCTRRQATAAISHAWADGHSLRVYRHAPNTGRRKSWAAGDAASRGVRLALMAMAGEEEIPAPLSAAKWGFCAVSFGGKPLTVARPFASYVMENILYKVSYPAEFHAQTAVECALKLHPQAVARLSDISRIRIDTQESAVRIISKSGELHNPADRDHCLQYMVAAALLFGDLTAAHYEDDIAADPRLDALREKMEVAECPQYSADYLHPDKRSIANAVQVFFADGEASERVEIEYPLGHRRRREESMPHLQKKFHAAARAVFSAARTEQITELFADGGRLAEMPARDFMDLLAAE